MRAGVGPSSAGGGSTSQAYAADYDGRTPLHLAASEGWIEAVRSLLALGASPFSRDRWGSTPADDAGRQGRREVAELLLSRRRTGCGGSRGESGTPRSGSGSQETLEAARERSAYAGCA